MSGRWIASDTTGATISYHLKVLKSRSDIETKEKLYLLSIKRILKKLCLDNGFEGDGSNVSGADRRTIKS